MKQSLIGFVVIVLTLFSMVAVAKCEEARPRKPAVCLSWELGQAGSDKIAVCNDGARKAVFVRYAIVEVDGVRYLLGWRS